MSHQDFCRWCVDHHCAASVVLELRPVEVFDSLRYEWVYTITLWPAKSVIEVPKVIINAISVSEGMEMATTAMGRLL